MAAPVVAGTVALMLQANPDLTPNLVKAILQFTSQEYPGYDALTQGAGFLNARGAVQLAEYFSNSSQGQRLSVDARMEQADLLGQQARSRRRADARRNGLGRATSSGARQPAGTNIVWGENCLDCARWATTSSGANEHRVGRQTVTTTSSGATPTTTTSSGATATTTTSSGATAMTTTSSGATTTTTTSSGATTAAATTTTTSSGATATTTTSCGATPTARQHRLGQQR